MSFKIAGKKITLFDYLPPEERKNTEKQIKEKAKGNTAFYAMVFISSIIISAGLIVNNSAVVIGGMIIAPLMWPLLALAISIIHWRQSSLIKNLTTLIITIFVILIVSFLIGFLYPLYELSNEVLLRTEPNIFDLIIALTAGFGGAFSVVYTKKSPTIFGVAMAVALVPPLCTVGILLGNNHLNLVGGALILFLTNLIAILLSAMFVLMMAKFSAYTSKENAKKRKKVIIYSLGSFLIILLLLFSLTWNVIGLTNIRKETKELFTEMFPDEKLDNLKVIESNSAYSLKGEVLSSNNFTEYKVNKFNNYLSQRLGKNINIDFQVIKVDRIISNNN